MEVVQTSPEWVFGDTSRRGPRPPPIATTDDFPSLKGEDVKFEAPTHFKDVHELVELVALFADKEDLVAMRQVSRKWSGASSCSWKSAILEKRRDFLEELMKDCVDRLKFFSVWGMVSLVILLVWIVTIWIQPLMLLRGSVSNSDQIISGVFQFVGFGVVILGYLSVRNFHITAPNIPNATVRAVLVLVVVISTFIGGSVVRNNGMKYRSRVNSLHILAQSSVAAECGPGIDLAYSSSAVANIQFLDYTGWQVLRVDAQNISSPPYVFSGQPVLPDYNTHIQILRDPTPLFTMFRTVSSIRESSFNSSLCTRIRSSSSFVNVSANVSGLPFDASSTAVIAYYLEFDPTEESLVQQSMVKGEPLELSAYPRNVTETDIPIGRVLKDEPTWAEAMRSKEEIRQTFVTGVGMLVGIPFAYIVGFAAFIAYSLHSAIADDRAARIELKELQDARDFAVSEGHQSPMATRGPRQITVRNSSRDASTGGAIPPSFEDQYSSSEEEDGER